jgi:hypothetical protein
MVVPEGINGPARGTPEDVLSEASRAQPAIPSSATNVDASVGERIVISSISYQLSAISFQLLKLSKLEARSLKLLF